MIKRAYVFLVGLCLIIGLSACGASPEQEHQTTLETQFKDFVASRTAVDPDEAMTYAKDEVCQPLEDGTPIARVMLHAATDTRFRSQDDAAVVVGAGIAAFCPEFSDDLSRLANGLSNS